MSNVHLLTALLMAASFAGCIGASDTDADEPVEEQSIAVPDANWSVPGLLADGTPAPTSFTLEGCDEQSAVFPVPAEFGDELPDGFSYEPFGVPGMAAVPGMITMFVLSLDCGYMDGRSAEMWGLLMVNPSPEYEVEGAVLYAVPLGGFAANEDVFAIYQAYGVGDGLELGDVMMESTGGAPLPVTVGHVMASSGDFAVHFYNEVAGPVTAGDAGQARIFNTNGKHVESAFDVSWTEGNVIGNGHATLQMQGDLDPFMVIPLEGLGFHWFGEEYDITVSYASMPVMMMTDEHEH